MPKKKFYTVWKGRTPGVYASWDACQKQVVGFEGAQYMAFDNQSQAEFAFTKNPWTFIGKNGPSKKKELPSGEKPIAESLSVDAACSGNPGVMEYRGVNTKTREEVFHLTFPLGTNNIGEFLALVHGLALLKQKGLPNPIYTDSRTAMAWLKGKKCKTKLARTAATEELFQLIERAEKWLKEHTYKTLVLKWDTESWGEIPADFGRKG